MPIACRRKFAGAAFLDHLGEGGFAGAGEVRAVRAEPEVARLVGAQVAAPDAWMHGGKMVIVERNAHQQLPVGADLRFEAVAGPGRLGELGQDREPVAQPIRKGHRGTAAKTAEEHLAASRDLHFGQPRAEFGGGPAVHRLAIRYVARESFSVVAPSMKMADDRPGAAIGPAQRKKPVRAAVFERPYAGSEPLHENRAPAQRGAEPVVGVGDVRFEAEERPHAAERRLFGAEFRLVGHGARPARHRRRARMVRGTGVVFGSAHLQ